jgi:hypothetical protein
MSNGNVPVTGNHPAVEFQPSETSSVWHTDQEFTGSSGNSKMARTYNAQYDTNISKWKTLTTGVSQAYATVQNPDGSIHYYSNYNPDTSRFESTWTDWFGSGNNAVYNGADFGMDPAIDNTAALNNAITAVMNAGGGEVRIPPGTYPISGIIDLSFAGVPGNDQGIIIRGVSGKAEILQSTITSDVFLVSGHGSGRGIRFEDLRITYASPNDPQGLSPGN